MGPAGRDHRPPPAARVARRAWRTTASTFPSSSLDPYGGLVLLPHPRGDEHAWDGAAVEALVGRLASAADAEVWAGTTAAGVAEVPAAARLAREIVDLVRRTARAAGTYAMDDVLLDYQALAPGAGRRRAPGPARAAQHSPGPGRDPARPPRDRAEPHAHGGAW
ncbi:hypothetical protein [Nocardioides convexus]|uniref:hypothetical protein n=1 Tax=Nocardioides convexus TaxID=2712224 RepID=UPI0024188321|nr:hypothetical protein [Nocardioides convexus]